MHSDLIRLRGVLIFSALLDIWTRTGSDPAHGGVQGFDTIKVRVTPDELGLDDFNCVDRCLNRCLHRRLERARHVRGLDHAHTALLARRSKQARRIA